MGGRRINRVTVVAVALALFGSLAAAAFAASTNFLERASSPEPLNGLRPSSIVRADFNGDGNLDLATANLVTGDVSILRNNGTGNFVELGTSPEPAGLDPTGIDSADFDGDGDADLAVSNRDSGDVTILRNNGFGNFVEPASSPEAVGESPVDIVAADFDSDGDADLAVANTSDVTILRNNGSGNFAELATSPVPVSAFAAGLAAEDLDGDTDPDLAVTSFEDELTILRNNGGGVFTEAATSPEPVGDAPGEVALVDLDGDGDTDAATSNRIGDTVTILLNVGGADFVDAPHSPESAGDHPLGISAGDFDSDGDTDLATANETSNDVTILKNKGLGDFSIPASSPEPAGDEPYEIAVADVDGDFDLDLAVANHASSNVTILRNR